MEKTLRSNCLSFSELLAQAIALISPTMTAALIIPVMYSNTGNLSWMAYAIGTAMLFFVALSLNQFARRSTGSGSMYAYVCHGLGLTAGGIAGWSLIWAYLGIAMAGITGFSIFSGKLLAMMGINLPPVALFALCVAIAWYCAWKNVQLSAMLMLIFEGASMFLIIILCLISLGRHHFAFDMTQFDFKGTQLSSMGLGVVVAIFSLVGFECATAFGDEAKNPLRTIPKAVVWSLVISGVFFIFVTYAMVDGVRGYQTPLDQIDAPLNVLAELAQVKILQVPLSFGAMVSFFALCLSCVSAGARVIYAMGRHGLFPAAIAGTHSRNETPHVAVTAMCLVAVAIPTVSVLCGLAPLDIFNYVGTLAAFGFLATYFLITIAAPVYLKGLGQLRRGNLAVCAIALLLLLIPAVGSVYPVPAQPVKYFPYLFLAYLLIGIGWVTAYYRRAPTANVRIQQDLQLNHARFERPLAEVVEVA